MIPDKRRTITSLFWLAGADGSKLCKHVPGHPPGLGGRGCFGRWQLGERRAETNMAKQPPTTLTWREDITPHDVPLIERLAESSGFFRPDEVTLAVEFAARRLRKGPESGYEFLFAQKGDMTLGYACYGLIAGTLHSWNLYWIMVDHKTRSRGMGSKLLTQVEKRVAAAKGERLYIETSSQPMYQPTRRFYQSRGYTLLTVLEDFYARGDGKMIYAKNMPDLAKG